MRTKITLLQLLYKSRLFGQNERCQWKFRILLPGKKKGKARWSYDKMLIDWVRSGRTVKYLALGHGARTSLRSVRTPWPRAKYFPVRPSHSVNKYIILTEKAWSIRDGLLEKWWGGGGGGGGEKTKKKFIQGKMPREKIRAKKKVKKKKFMQKEGPILGFHMTSRPPCWCPQTMKWRPCWCPDPILREFKAIIMLTSSFVFVEKHGCWSREWNPRIVTFI